jgi:hypothetical protein
MAMQVLATIRTLLSALKMLCCIINVFYVAGAYRIAIHVIAKPDDEVTVNSLTAVTYDERHLIVSSKIGSNDHRFI